MKYLWLLTLLPSSLYAIDYYFEKDLGVEGFIRHCQYSNDQVYTVQSTDICPMSVRDEGISSYGGNSRYVGFSKGDYLEGMSKICVYDVLGDTQHVRFDATDICPPTYEFRF